MKNLRIAGKYESRNSDVWFITEDRKWKLRMNPNETMTLVHNSYDIYELREGVAYNARKGTKVYGESYTAHEIAEIVKNVTAIL